MLETKLKHKEEEWVARGRQEDEQIGMQKGEQIGIQKERHEIARRLKSRGMTISEVAEITGLSQEEVRKL